MTNIIKEVTLASNDEASGVSNIAGSALNIAGNSEELQEQMRHVKNSSEKLANIVAKFKV